MRKMIGGLLVLMCLALTMPLSAQAAGDLVNYKPGLVKAAIAKGKTVVLFYKSTW